MTMTRRMDNYIKDHGIMKNISLFFLFVVLVEHRRVCPVSAVAQMDAAEAAQAHQSEPLLPHNLYPRHPLRNHRAHVRQS